MEVFYSQNLNCSLFPGPKEIMLNGIYKAHHLGQNFPVNLTKKQISIGNLNEKMRDTPMKVFSQFSRVSIKS